MRVYFLTKNLKNLLWYFERGVDAVIKQNID